MSGSAAVVVTGVGNGRKAVKTKKAISVFSAIAGFILLLWIWPNLIHEPLHLVALKLQGSTGDIAFDLSWPPHPSIQRGPVAGLAGGLFFLLFPSAVSIAILFVLWATARRRPNPWLHGVLATYLSFDLVVNLMGYGSPTNDFHFLVALPFGSETSLAGSAIVVLIGTYLIYHIHRLVKLNPERVERE